MPFEGIIGNGSALDRLRGIVKQNRPAHAYLFRGPNGVGKKLAATEFARALGAETSLIERAKDKKWISIAQVQEVIRQLNLTSSARRAVIFDDAHLTSEEGMNALLKTLEEPPGDTVLILVTAVPHRLLDTIRSRCHTVIFTPLSEEEARRHARETLRLDDDAARIMAVLSGGSVGRAIALMEDFDDVRATAREIQERVLSGDFQPFVEAFSKIKESDLARRRAKRDLGLLAQCLRETLKSRAGETPSLATAEFVARFSRLDDDDLLERIETILDHSRLIDLNANVALTVEDALLRV